MIAAVAGGWLASTSWRVEFIALGLPGALFALAMRLLIREPVRGALDPEGERIVPPPYIIRCAAMRPKGCGSHEQCLVIPY